MPTRRTSKGKRRTQVDDLDLAVSRGFVQAPNTQAYETILRDPEVQMAVEKLIEKMVLASRKDKERRPLT